jgi:hypothetical protein
MTLGIWSSPLWLLTQPGHMAQLHPASRPMAEAGELAPTAAPALARLNPAGRRQVAGGGRVEDHAGSSGS